MNQVNSKLMLIDGHSLAYRAFHALPVEKFSNPQGTPVNAVYGLCNMILSLIKEYEPSHIAVCFDVGRDTFRKQIYPEYKANRSASPVEFKAQQSLLRELVNAFGIKIYSDPYYEADDLLASLATKAKKENLNSLIVTSDRDAFQLIDDQVQILYPKKGLADTVIMDGTELFNKYGLTPEQYPDFAALRGDPSDNLPGIPGVGEKTATSWIQEFRSLSNLFENQELLKGKVGDSFRSNIENVKRNRLLTELKRDISVIEKVAELKWESKQADGLFDFCTEQGFRSLLSKVRALSPNAQAEIKSDLKTGGSGLALGINLEAQEIRIWNGQIQTNHVFEDTSDLLMQLNELTQGQNFAVENLKQLQKDLLSSNSEIPIKLAKKLQDIIILQYLINPGSRPVISDLDTNDDQLSFDTNEQNLLPAIGEAIFQLSQDTNFPEALQLYENLEAGVALTLASMEHVGIAIDTKQLSDLIAKYIKIQSDTELQAHQIHGRNFNLGSPKQLQDVLFVERGLSKTKKTKTGFTTDSDALTSLQLKHPQDELLPLLQQWRDVSKLKQMLVSLDSAVTKGRIHTSFQQTIAATGRLSSTNPNLQNVPIKTEAGRQIRGIFISNQPYGQLITADYSQIELRIMAHLASDSALIAAFESGEDLHVSVASVIFGVSPSEVTPELRSQVKAVSYGLAYGLSAYGLSQGLRIDVSEADQLMNKFFERFSGVRDYLKEVVIQARSKGYTETLLGRKRMLPDLNSDNRVVREIAERMALNAPIQGTAADIIKIAMVRVHNRLSESNLKARLLLQVHDELVLETSAADADAVVTLVKNEMQSAMQLKVNLDVSVGVGKSWLSAAHG